LASYKDIQRRTGLSLATISKYYNGGTVLEENRAAIDLAVAELNFRPNAFARGLREQRSRTVGVLLPALNNDFHLTIIAGVEEALRVEGLTVIVSSSPTPQAAAVDVLLERMVDGIIAIPSPHDVEPLREAALRIPVVVVDWDAPDVPADRVFLDNLRAGRIAAQHLLDHGHRRIGVVGGDDAVSSLRLRAAGFLEGLDARAVEVDPTLSISGPLTVGAGHDATVRLLERADRPTALFAANYELTLGTVIAINESGLRMGRDISVLGFDSVELA
jgi:LacI family transcriptional regulator